MGTLSLVESGEGEGVNVNPGMRSKRTKTNSNAAVSSVMEDLDIKVTRKGKQKRTRLESNENVPNTRKMPKRAAACTDFKDKSVRLSVKSSTIENKSAKVVDEERAAIASTMGPDVPRSNRRLTDFIFHTEDGTPQPIEWLEVDELFISGLILPFEKTSENEKETGIRCELFGRIESWNISGYEDGSPVVWVSTDLADYDCVKPATSYKNLYGLFYEKAHASVEIYKKLSKSAGGNLGMSLDELLAGVVRSLSSSKNFPHGAPIRDLLISWGGFIYDQLVGLDETCDDNNLIFSEIPVLAALRDESKKNADGLLERMVFSGGMKSNQLRIGDGEKVSQSSKSVPEAEEDETMKMVRLLQEKEDWLSLGQKKRSRPISSSNKLYIQINEDEIANDYPLPAYYSTSVEEADEYMLFDEIDTNDPDQLPRHMLHNWSLYNCDSRLISLELLPMRPCADIDVTVFGSGIMTADDGSGFCLDDESGNSSGTVARNEDGIPIYLSAVKEWMIEFGASMVFISIRTDMAWYRLGKPSKQYASWYQPVLKTAKLAIGIITLLKEQTRVSKLGFLEVIKRLSELDKAHPAYISSNLAIVERYVVVHGQIILQQFAEFPDDTIKKSAFITGLQDKMEERHHTKWLVKKKAIIEKDGNMNPRAAMAPIVSSRKAMPATTTRLINRIWGEFYSNYSPEEGNEVACEVKKDEDEEKQEEAVEDDCEDVEEDKIEAPEVAKKSFSPKQRKSQCSTMDIKWDGKPAGKTSTGKSLYKQAIVRGCVISVGSSVLVETSYAEDDPPIFFVEYMFEDSDARKCVHGRMMLRGCQTVLGNTANEREVFLTNDCIDFELNEVIEMVTVEVRLMPWGYQHRKANANFDKTDRAKAAERKEKGLPLEFFCKSSYLPHKGAFISLQTDLMGLGTGICHSCNVKEPQKDVFKLSTTMKSFTYQATEYCVNDFLYVAPHYFDSDDRDNETHKGGRNVGLKAFAVCQLLEIEGPKSSKKTDPELVNLNVRRFFRPEDISAEKAYCSEIQEVYYSEKIVTVPLVSLEGKCEVRRKQDFISSTSTYVCEHIFFCERQYYPHNGSLKQLPLHIKLSTSKESAGDDAAAKRKRKGKCKEGEMDIDSDVKQENATPKNCLSTLDIFAGCGGLSEGLQQAGASVTKWAIEYEEPAGQAFKLNHPEALMFTHNCNVILRAIMTACGDADDCISTSEAAELVEKLEENEIKNLPRPGQVDFINGGPPCQGFSGMNRFNHGTWSKVQCEMILAFLSFAEYFRPKYFLLENVRNFVSFNKGQTFRLALASLLEMGYQVRFGILEAGAYGVSQSRKRAFIWAASPEETLPEWPEPMHVFAGPELKVSLNGKMQYSAVRSTATGAPFRAITVRDTIGDLPAVGNGASAASIVYKNEPFSWFQRRIRGDMKVLTDHISKEMNELNLIRCQRIPKRPGADWRDLPEEKVRLSTGQMVDLIPWCLPNTAKRHNQWKGLYGRLDWEGNFPTSVTDPQPMGKVGMCFHPEQDRILTVRECARSQGFPDRYKFAGNIQHKHRQIGNAVPPPLAFALGRKLKEALEMKNKTI